MLCGCYVRCEYDYHNETTHMQSNVSPHRRQAPSQLYYVLFVSLKRCHTHCGSSSIVRLSFGGGAELNIIPYHLLITHRAEAQYDRQPISTALLY